MTATLSFEKVRVGEEIAALVVPLSATQIVAAALATRDFENVHHDKDEANRRGLPNVIMNILTTNGFISRYVTDWTGPTWRIRSIATRLGVPNFAGDTMRVVGAVTRRGEGPGGAPGAAGEVEVQVRILNALGEHANSTVVVAPHAQGAP